VLPALGAITVGSLIGGHVAYFLASKVRSIGFFRRGARRAEKTMHNLIERFGTWALVIGSLTPVPYSFLCYLSGLNRLPYKKFLVLCALRVPKVALYYGLVVLGWSV
jgi:membrane protein YqaA with SNARE-associated domain